MLDDLRRLIRDLLAKSNIIIAEDDIILERENEILTRLSPHLAYIKVRFTLGGHMAEGPVTATVGQSFKATVDGFDQFGAPWTGAVPPVSYSIDNPALDSSTPESDNFTDDLVSLGAGTANLTASLTTAEGKVLSDTETITNVAAAPVLSSIKINFSTPASAASAVKKA